MVAAKLFLLVAAGLSDRLPTQDDVIEAAVLRALELKPSPPALRAFITSKTPVPVTDARFAALVRDLAVEDFKTREGAQAELVRGGPAVVERLRAASQVLKHPGQVDLIKGCLIRITKEWSPKGVAAYRAAVRAVSRRPDPAAVSCLLGALPTLAEDDEVLAAAWRALDAVAVRERAVPKACADARTDGEPGRRAVAAFLLGRRGTAEQRRQAVGMLADPDPSVRLRAAQGLLGAGDLSGVPVLVALLDAKPVPLAWEAEELLVWLAGASAPKERVGDGHKAAQVRKAWERWRETAKPDWKKAAEAPGRPLLLLVRSSLPAGKRLPTVLIGSDGGTRWTATSGKGQNLVVDQVTASGRVLGFAWPDPDDRPPGRWADPPALAEFVVGGKSQGGKTLDLDGYSDFMIRRWVGGWTLVAGRNRYGFIPPDRHEVVEWVSVAALTGRADDDARPPEDLFAGEQGGVLCYVCRDAGSTSALVAVVEPGGRSAWGPPHPIRPRPRNEARIGPSSVRTLDGRVWETRGGRRLWEAPLRVGPGASLSANLQLIRLGFDDLDAFCQYR